MQHFPILEIHIRSEVARGSNRLTQAMPWASEIDKLRVSHDMAACSIKLNLRDRYWRLQQDLGFGERQWLNDDLTWRLSETSLHRTRKNTKAVGGCLLGDTSHR